MACSPKFDWREVRGVDAPFTILMPAKAASFSRPMTLAGLTLNMQMTAADAGGVSFAVGYSKVLDVSKIPEILASMQAGMLKNIQATSSQPHSQDGSEIEALGQLQNGQAVKLRGRFVARGNWVYQVVIIGPEKALSAEIIDTFLTSFKPG